jgi:RNA polymerase sigma factor (TIGR02999 family)
LHAARLPNQRQARHDPDTTPASRGGARQATAGAGLHARMQRMPEDADAPRGVPPPAWAAAYPELKKIARARLHAAGTQPGLNTTALVNESFLRLAGRVGQLHFSSHGHFYAYAAQVMRSVVVDLVRQRQAERHGGGAAEVTLDTAVQLGLRADDGTEALRVDEALTALAAVEPRLAQVVEMRYFAGMTDAEIAQVLGLTDRTVRRDWDKARLLLSTMLG